MSASGGKIRILVAEDDSDISSMLCDLLSFGGYEPVPAYSGTEAVMRLASLDVDLILLDLMLPGMSGAEVLAEIRKNGTCPIIVLTAIKDKESVVSLLKAGANDYVTKPFDNDELLARIEAQLRNRDGVASAPATIFTFREMSLDTEAFDAFIDEEPLGLSKREYEILHLMMQSPQKVFTKNNLYESVWQEEFLGDDNTINVHISNIRGKIAKYRPEDEYIKTVWGIGFKLN